VQEACNCFTIDVEDWFHILDTPAAPTIDQWASMKPRVDIGLNRMLDLLDKYSVKATMFWLGWMAEQHPALIRRCADAGHEIASHGYGHVLAYEVGPDRFLDDISRGKAVLQDITGRDIAGFRAAGFSTTEDTDWTFEKISQAGYAYDSSVFPANRGHGGKQNSRLEPSIIETPTGKLVELPQSMIEVAGKRVSLFGGGYLRLAPKWLIRSGVKRLHRAGRPLILYVHPREADPDHPRLPIGFKRSFKSYINLKTTLPKLEMLCRDLTFVTMQEVSDRTRQAVNAVADPTD
jgi:polysaccharide deacetylase family protein (PEP-CTERM system associated)